MQSPISDETQQLSQCLFTCLCAVCRNDIVVGDKLADHRVFDSFRELKYIELAHEDCAVRDNALRVADDKPPYWTVS